ncbi:hypothetical protein EHP00_337 [Ecytonucleospora hepatopenaei]|uniref:Uncharacterized protein n=1 Tax=Ecytonucleospora hepatopenaei TaxID=646526 RepID=A0A1W0E7D5_9MICR|nr:hypothetical protein EHP00_337 [Ecytonucleospora hepatopenaei]
MQSIEESEEFLFYLEQIDNKFNSIKTILREIKHKIKNESVLNKKIVENCKHWVNFFHLNSNVLMQKEGKLQESSGVENLKINLSETDTVSSTSTIDDQYKTFINTSNSFSIFDITKVPVTLANEPVLTDLMEYLKTHKTIALEKLSTLFPNVSDKKIEIIINFLVGRNYIIKKNNKLFYSESN